MRLIFSLLNQSKGISIARIAMIPVYLMPLMFFDEFPEQFCLFPVSVEECHDVLS